MRLLMGPIHCSWDPQISFFNKIFIKNWSHNTIHIFKNYFVTIFLIFINMHLHLKKKKNNMRYPNKPLKSW